MVTTVEELIAVVLVVPGGINTVSMRCTTPLVAAMSAVVTFELPFTVTPEADDVTNKFCPCSVFTSCLAFRSLLYTADPENTWYVRTPTYSCLFCGCNNLFSAAFGSFLNAAFVGANTVNGPLPCNAVTRSPACSALTNVDKPALP